MLLPKRHEASQMVSPRERTAVGKQWQSAVRDNSQLSQYGIALQRIQNEMGKLRRRIPGGASAGQSGGLQFKGQYNGGAYKTQNMVIFTPDGQSPGTYIALQAVPSGQSPDVGFPYWVALPTSPSGVWA